MSPTKQNTSIGSDLTPLTKLTRRQCLSVGSLGVLGLGLPELLASTSSKRNSSQQGQAKACILVFAWGGPSQLDTWDPKPDAPAEIRGEFSSINTTVPGLRISEHFPMLAQRAKQYTVIRSMMHDDPAHLSSVHHILTGRYAPNVKSDKDGPSRRDTPHIGAVLSKLRPTPRGMPPFVTMPWIVSHPAAPGGVAPGQNAGWLGTAHDPFVVHGNPNTPNFAVRGLMPHASTPAERIENRRTLLHDLNKQNSLSQSMSDYHARAFDLLTSAKTQRAFQIHREPSVLRERYGRHIHGQSLLLARRLIEAGVRLVCVNWHQDGKAFWDTHGDNFNRLKKDLMPPTDRGFSALLDDLSQRGMLDETLVVWVGEFGRKPQISKNNAGREHWPQCYSAVLAGGGIQGGQIYGSSDKHAAYPAEKPVLPADFTATIYSALGIEPETILKDRENRPITLTEGTAISELL